MGKKPKQQVTWVERCDLIANDGITLNGKHALIIGTRNQFATVRQYPTGESAEFAWETVKRIITDKKGKFKA